MRPRALLASAVSDNAAAANALSSRFGFRLSAGEVKLDRSYDETRASVGCDGGEILRLRLREPMQIGEGDTQFVSSLHPARTPRGFRLLQVDSRHQVHRAERGELDLEVFDARAWGESRIVPTLPLPAVIGFADWTIDRIRFVCRADVMAFEGTEPVIAD